MLRGESEISITNGMSLCYVTCHINTQGAQLGLCLSLISQEPKDRTYQRNSAEALSPTAILQANQS